MRSNKVEWVMWRFGSLSLLLFFGLVSCGPPVAVEQSAGSGFSADFLITDPENSFGGTTVGKLYFDDPGLRVENKIDDETAVIIFDFSRNILILLDLEEKSYSEAAWLDGELGLMEWLFSKEGGPCGEGEDERVQATKLGIETLDGRKVEKWRCTYESSEGSALTWTLWDDVALPILIRVEISTGLVFALSNLVVAPQPAALFLVPAGYTKRADPQGPTIDLELPN